MSLWEKAVNIFRQASYAGPDGQIRKAEDLKTSAKALEQERDTKFANLIETCISTDETYQKALQANSEAFENQLKNSSGTKAEYEAAVKQKNEADAAAYKQAMSYYQLKDGTIDASKVYDTIQELYDKANGQDAASTNPASELNEKTFWEKLRNGELLSTLAYWLYDVVAFCINTFAELGLLILSIFFPWILCLSLLDYFKQAIWQFFATYLSLSLYKVVVAIIDWAIHAGVATIYSISLTQLLPAYSSASAKGDALAVTITSTVMLYIAGFIAMTKVGSIVSMIIPGGASTGDFGGGGAAIATGAMSKGAAAAKGAMGVVKGVATGQSGIQQAIKSKKSGNATQEFQQNVTNALGKLTGNSSSNSSSGS